MICEYEQLFYLWCQFPVSVAVANFAMSSEELFASEVLSSDDELEFVMQLQQPNRELAPNHFVGRSGQNIHIDEGLFEDDDLSDDSQEEAARQQALQREIMAWQSIEGKKMSELTPGQKRIKRVLEADATGDDSEKTLNNDLECLQYDPVPCPELLEAVRELGPSPPRSDCFGCERGVGVVEVSNEKIVELEAMIIAMYPYATKIKIAKMAAAHFEHHIRRPANDTLRKGEMPLQRWLARSIYDHLTVHTNEPSLRLENVKDYMKDHIHQLLTTEVYRIPKNAKRRKVAVHTPTAQEHGRHPSMLVPADNRDVRVNPAGHRMLMDSVKLYVQLTNQNPETMANTNTKFSVPSGPKSLFTQSSNKQTTPKTIFD